MPLVLAGATSGSTTIQATDGATQTITLPNNTGTIVTSATTQAGMPPNIASNGPAFSAERTTSQSFSQNTFVKVLCENEMFDTNSNYDNATNYRFTPTVAGYYHLSGTVTMTSSSTNDRQILAFFKNNSQILRPVDFRIPYGTATAMFTGSGLVYMNGSTDYIELFVYITGSGTLSIVAQGAGELSTFSGFLARAA